MDVADLNFSGVPADLRQHSYKVEFIESKPCEVVSVPGLLGWSAHAGVRLDATPMNTHVCSSSYDHINIDVDAAKVAKLYDQYPQLDTLISLAGMPGALTVADANQVLAEWGATPSDPVGTLPPAKLDDVYAAAPVFVMHRVGLPNVPLAICACRFRVANNDITTINIDARIDWVAVSPDHRNEGLAHLVLLEASRWLGMLARSITISDKRSHELLQRVSATPRDSSEYHFAQVFYSNFGYFCVTEELTTNTQNERSNGLIKIGTLRSGLASITSYTPLEDAIHIPDDVLSRDISAGHEFPYMDVVENAQ